MGLDQKRKQPIQNYSIELTDKLVKHRTGKTGARI